MNSLKVILDPCSSPGILSAKIWIREGSRADPINKKGIHNLLGSLLTRGCGPYNNLQISELVEGCGAGLNCETYEDGLLISLKCTEQKSPQLLPILSYLITDPHLDHKQIALEKKLLIQSINRQKESSFNLAFLQWKKIAYKDHPYSHETIGYVKDIRDTSRNQLSLLSKRLLYREKTLLIAGSLPTKVENYISKIKESSSTNNIDPTKTTPGKEINKNNLIESIVLNYQNTNQVILILGKSTIPHSHPDDLALRIIGCHLGSGMSSILFRTLREKNGLAYDVGVYNPIREFNAPFLIHASSSKEKSMATLQLLIKCWNDILNKSLLDDELDLAKAKFRGNLAHNSQTISQRAERKVHLLGLRMNPNHDIINLKKLTSITSKEIIESARNHLSKPLLSLVGSKDIINNLSEYWQKETKIT